jgi:hypothetical protein
MHMPPPSSGSNSKPSKKQHESSGYLLSLSFLLGLFFNLKDGGDIFLKNPE